MIVTQPERLRRSLDSARDDNGEQAVAASAVAVRPSCRDAALLQWQGLGGPSTPLGMTMSLDSAQDDADARVGLRVVT